MISFHFNCLNLAIFMVKGSKKTSTHFHTNLMQYPTNKYEKRLFALQMAVLEWFFMKYSHGSLEVNPLDLSVANTSQFKYIIWNNIKLVEI